MTTNNQTIEIRPCNIPNQKGIDAIILAVSNGEAVQIAMGRRQDCKTVAAQIAELCKPEVMVPNKREIGKKSEDECDVFEFYMKITDEKTFYIGVQLYVHNENVDATGKGKHYFVLNDSFCISKHYIKPDARRILADNGVIKTTRGTYRIKCDRLGDRPSVTRIDGE